jgi:hypothetical protein
LRGVFEFFMLQQPLYQFFARIFLLALGCLGIARQQQLALDVDQQGSHVDEFRRNVHVQVLQVFHIPKILSRDFGNGNVININILLADKVQQQIERAVIHLADAHREREFIRLWLCGL